MPPKRGGRGGGRGRGASRGRGRGRRSRVSSGGSSELGGDDYVPSSGAPVVDTSQDALLAQALEEQEPRNRRSSRACKGRLTLSEIQDAQMEPEKERHQVGRYDFDALLSDDKFNCPELVNQIDPKDFNMDYYQKTGLKDVLLFNCPPDELGMKMVDDSFTPRDVEKCVGSNRIITCVRVSTQGSEDMKLCDFVNYYFQESSNRSTLFNVLSLEFSNTKLADLVQSPKLVREIDWASSWPDERKYRSVTFDKNGGFRVSPHFPRVQNYCLMSVEKCYTDFHIDFHGTSVWYHVKRGQKIFWIVEPTEQNIRLYEEYLKNESELGFFGYVPEKCHRVTLHPGNTLIIPSGWIHSVYTPVDSLVFGGNFLHSHRATMQIQVLQSENRIGIQKRYRYPYSEEAVFFDLAKTVKRITGREYIRPESANRQHAWLEYIGDQFIAKNCHHRVPIPEDYKDDGLAWMNTWEESDEYKAGMKKMEPWEKKEEAEEEQSSSEEANVVVNAIGLEEEATSEDDEQSGRTADEMPKLTKKANTSIDDDLSDVPTDPPSASDAATASVSAPPPALGGHDDFFIDDLTFYHPESFNCDAGPKAYSTHTLPLSSVEPKMNVNYDELRSALCAGVITEYESLLKYFYRKTKVDVPTGLTRPNSLLKAMETLLKLRRQQLMDEEGVSLPQSILDKAVKPHPASLARRKNAAARKLGEPDSDYDPSEDGKAHAKRRSSKDPSTTVPQDPSSYRVPAAAHPHAPPVAAYQQHPHHQAYQHQHQQYPHPQMVAYQQQQTRMGGMVPHPPPPGMQYGTHAPMMMMPHHPQQMQPGMMPHMQPPQPPYNVIGFVPLQQQQQQPRPPPVQQVPYPNPYGTGSAGPAPMTAASAPPSASAYVPGQIGIVSPYPQLNPHQPPKNASAASTPAGCVIGIKPKSEKAPSKKKKKDEDGAEPKVFERWDKTTWNHGFYAWYNAHSAEYKPLYMHLPPRQRREAVRKNHWTKLTRDEKQFWMIRGVEQYTSSTSSTSSPPPGAAPTTPSTSTGSVANVNGGFDAYYEQNRKMFEYKYYLHTDSNRRELVYRNHWLSMSPADKEQYNTVILDISTPSTSTASERMRAEQAEIMKSVIAGGISVKSAAPQTVPGVITPAIGVHMISEDTSSAIFDFVLDPRHKDTLLEREPEPFKNAAHANQWEQMMQQLVEKINQQFGTMLNRNSIYEHLRHVKRMAKGNEKLKKYHRSVERVAEALNLSPEAIITKGSGGIYGKKIDRKTSSSSPSKNPSTPPVVVHPIEDVYKKFFRQEEGRDEKRDIVPSTNGNAIKIEQQPMKEVVLEEKMEEDKACEGALTEESTTIVKMETEENNEGESSGRDESVQDTTVDNCGRTIKDISIDDDGATTSDTSRAGHTSPKHEESVKPEPEPEPVQESEPANEEMRMARERTPDTANEEMRIATEGTPKRGRGRPRKTPLNSPVLMKDSSTGGPESSSFVTGEPLAVSVADPSPPAKKKKGNDKHMLVSPSNGILAESQQQQPQAASDVAHGGGTDPPPADADAKQVLGRYDWTAFDAYLFKHYKELAEARGLRASAELVDDIRRNVWALLDELEQRNYERTAERFRSAQKIVKYWGSEVTVNSHID